MARPVFLLHANHPKVKSYRLFERIRIESGTRNALADDVQYPDQKEKRFGFVQMRSPFDGQAEAGRDGQIQSSMRVFSTSEARRIRQK